MKDKKGKKAEGGGNGSAERQPKLAANTKYEKVESSEDNFVKNTACYKCGMERQTEASPRSAADPDSAAEMKELRSLHAGLAKRCDAGDPTLTMLVAQIAEAEAKLAKNTTPWEEAQRLRASPCTLR